MLIKSAVAILAVASQVAAEPQPYKAANAVHKMSVRELFGVVRRSGTDGYSPSSSLCGLGQTCAEACGAGYATCKSSDDAIHCYDSTSQICCPDNSGNSCDDGYYCTGSVGGDTVCCPNSQSLTECAAAYSVSGSLTAEVATSSSFSSSIASSSSAVITSSSVAITLSSSVAPNTTTSCTSSTFASSTFASTTASNTSSTDAKTTSYHYTFKSNSTAITSWGTSFTTTPCSTTTAITDGTGAASTAAAGAANTPGAAGAAGAAGGSDKSSNTGSSSATATTVVTSAGEFLKPAGVAAAMLAAAFTLLL